MADNRKSFFKDREANQILDLNVIRVYSPRGLVKRILDLDPATQALEVRTPIIPPRFIGQFKEARASRLNYKHGDFIHLSQPHTQWQAYSCNDIPLAIRARDFKQLQGRKEEEINFVGYVFKPVQSQDARKRIVPFVWLPEAARIFAYGEKLGSPVEVDAYSDSAKVKHEGADIVCKVPSRTKKRGRYTVKLQHVPVNGATERRAVAWSLKSQFQQVPEHSTYNIRYTHASDKESSDVFTFYPQDIAAYLGVIRDATKMHNLTPIEMSPLAIPSNLEVQFYKKLCNNLVIYDPTLSSKYKLRNLHIDEKSILIARSIGVLGHDATMYWDAARDGRLKDYDWTVQGKE